MTQRRVQLTKAAPARARRRQDSAGQQVSRTAERFLARAAP